MIKGISGYGYFDTLRIPIIENTAWEHELADSLGEAIAKNPKACAVLVRRHGMYVWGNTWEEAKRHGECLHYLFDIAIRMKQLGLDFNAPPRPLAGTGANPSYKHILLDIEGTTTPITFVKDTLFPHAEANIGAYLLSQWSNASTAVLVAQLQQQARDDVSSGAGSAVAAAFAEADLSAADGPACAAATEYAISLIKADRKVGPLKALQGLIWEQAYRAGSIRGAVFDDFPSALERWTKARDTGDAAGLVALLRACRAGIADPHGTLAGLIAQCSLRAPLFDPRTERAALLALLDELRQSTPS